MNKPFFYPLIKTIVSLSGYMHDFGKANQLFQNKIRGSEDKVDIIRHEFLSFYIVLKLIEMYEADMIINSQEAIFLNQEKWQRIFYELNNISETESYAIINKIKNILNVNNDFYNFNMTQNSQPMLHCILFSILTHHVIPSALYPYKAEDLETALHDKLKFSNINRISSINSENVEKLKKNIALHENYYINSSLEESINSGIKKIYQDCQDLSKWSIEDKELFFKSFSIVSRILLVLSDHNVSSLKKRELNINKRQSDYKTTYANTNRDLSSPETPPTFNQTLDEHLFEVGETGQVFLEELISMNENLPTLSKDTLANIMEHSKHPDFMWQDSAVRFIKQQKNGQPTLILNMGTTGSGKTRMNVKALGALNEEGLRFTSVFNLKSLTLQTGSAYRKQLGLNPYEISVLIGDKNYLDIQNIDKENKELQMDNDSAPVESEYLLEGEFNASNHWSKHPSFIKNVEKNGYNIASFIGVPVLVSTIDFCINAGDLSQGTHHINAFLRMKSSDLIIDEIDSYEPEMLESVLRLISISAMNHRNIVISSATMSRHYISMIKKAFEHGLKLGNQLQKSNYIGQIFCISNLIDTKEVKQDQDFNDYIDSLCKKFSDNREKLATILYLEKKQKGFPAIFTAIKELHVNNHQKLNQKQISFGLIRVGQIKRAIALAKKYEKMNFSEHNIAGEKIEIKFLTYHSNLINSQRFITEEFLDEVLDKNQKDTQNSLVHKIVNESTATHIIFIIIATPVEEIGRDHDFDWAIIEPSSIQSIIQTAGRVNRHRKLTKNKPNIFILQYNLAYYYKKDNDKKPVYFTKPGLETIDHRYEQDIKKLLPWSENTQLYITSQLRYASRFADLDDKSIDNALKNLTFLFSDNKTKYWFREEYYQSFRLRKNEGKTFTYEVNWSNKQFYLNMEEGEANPKPINYTSSNNILSLSQNAYEEKVFKITHLKKWSNQSEITIYSDTQKQRIIFHEKFGFHFLEYN